MRLLDNPRYGDNSVFINGAFLTSQTADPDGLVHNIHRTCIARPHSTLITMCGVRVQEDWEPYEGLTSCGPCSLLAAYNEVGLR